SNHPVYIYNDTSFNGNAQVSATNLNFLGALGPFSISIGPDQSHNPASAAISGSFGVTIGDRFSSGRTDVDHLLSVLSPSLEGDISAYLPMRFSGLSIGYLNIPHIH